MPIQKLTPEIITAAIQGLESQKEKIEAQLSELRAMLTGSSGKLAATGGPARRQRRKLSSAARARISEVQRKRWEEFHKKQAPKTAQKIKAKRRLSAATRAKLIANLTKARAAKAAKKAAA